MALKSAEQTGRGEERSGAGNTQHTHTELLCGPLACVEFFLKQSPLQLQVDEKIQRTPEMFSF